MMIRSSSPEQVADWLELARAADEIADNLPCRQAPDLYFATQTEGHYSQLAIRACSDCPIRQMCGEYAIKHNETEGIWGGLTAGERKRIRRLGKYKR